MTRSVLVTGAGGYVGSLLIESLAADPGRLTTIVAMDVREPAERLDGITYVTMDIRDPSLRQVLGEHDVGTVVHLAAIVTPGRTPDRDLEYSIDVGGTENVLESCLGAGVRKVIVSSSGAAYGYHADNPEWLDEDDALRGNVEFAYADHKRQVEEMLAAWRSRHPELGQLVFRPGTILGRGTRNQITDLFDRPIIMGIRGAATPFVLIWDHDVVGCLRRGIFTDLTGVFNLAGDGVLTLAEMAERMGKRYVAMPAGVVRTALAVLRRLRLTQYGPEQVDFLCYRPVLANRRLKDEFGYVPRKTTSEVFDEFLAGRRGGP
ncbi:MAG: SDR family oxidoreductase [Actinobacteria bacterium]|nr:SDR family oxidoreductase [Actinomycetota bacterium]